MLSVQPSFFILFFVVSSSLTHVQLHAISLLGPPIMDKGYLFLEIVKLAHLGDHLGVISFVGQTRKFLFGFSSVAFISFLWALSLVWLCSSF